MSNVAQWCSTVQLLPVCVYMALSLVLCWSVIQWKAVALKWSIQFRYITEAFTDIHVARCLSRNYS